MRTALLIVPLIICLVAGALIGESLFVSQSSTIDTLLDEARWAPLNPITAAMAVNTKKSLNIVYALGGSIGFLAVFVVIVKLFG
ncbi:MAG: hypothetical protein V1818_02805 [Candidatus Aenigmatarchaeota archaeon]